MSTFFRRHAPKITLTPTETLVKVNALKSDYESHHLDDAERTTLMDETLPDRKNFLLHKRHRKLSKMQERYPSLFNEDEVTA